MKWSAKERSTSDGPLTGVALQRLQNMPTPTLLDWIDGSVTKIGGLVRDSQRGEEAARLVMADREAAALRQALAELLKRVD